MQQAIKSKMLRVTPVVLGMAALALGGFGFYLIRTGAYPAQGAGSLGHVGMVIAGIIAGFIALVFGLFAVLCLAKVKAVPRPDFPALNE